MKSFRFMDIVMTMIVMSMMVVPGIHAAPDSASVDTKISADDKQAFDEILTPVMKIYNFIKYSASVIAVIALLFAGISYMLSGSDPKKRENSKNVAGYVLMGLVIIWAAPLVVKVLI